MKKILTLLTLILVVALPTTSCSKDDSTQEVITIPKDTDTPSVEHNQLALYVSAKSVPVKTLVSFTTILNGENVTDRVSYYVNNVLINGSSIASINPGTFNIQAKLEGYKDSHVMTVVYGGGTTPNPEPERGNFIYNGVNYTATINILVLNGAFYEDEDATTPETYWTSMILDNASAPLATLGAFIEFRTPFIVSSGNQGTITLPNGTNERYIGIEQLLVNGELTEDITGTGTIHYQNFVIDRNTNAFTSNITFGTNRLQINYNGAYQFVDETPPNPASATHNITARKAETKTKLRILKK